MRREKFERAMVRYRNLRRTERTVWVILFMCLFFLFQFGIDIEYEHINKVSLNVLHTVTVIVSIVFGVVQSAVIAKTIELEKEIYNER